MNNVLNVEKLFGENVFTLGKMQERLPRKAYAEVKQIVSGIKCHYTAEEMVGKKVMVLVNLKPAKLAGVLSEGMLLCAEDAEGNLALMTPEKTMPAGAEIC